MTAVRCALCAAATGRAAVWGTTQRGYPRWLIHGLVVAGVAVGSVGIGLGTWRARPVPPVDCAPLEGISDDAVVFSGRPLLVWAICGHAAVVLLVDEVPTALAARAATHHVTVALLPAQDADPIVPTTAHASELLPGWHETAPGRFEAPPATP